MSTNRFGDELPGPDTVALSEMVRELADRARRIAPRCNEFDATEASGVARVLLIRWARRVPSPGLPDPVATLSSVAEFVSDMLDAGPGPDTAERMGDEPGIGIDTAEETLLRLIDEHPDSDWLGYVEAALPAALASARIVDAPPSFRLSESLHSLRGVTPVAGAGVVLTTDTWVTGTECRHLFPGASRIIEKAIRDRDSEPEPASPIARSYLPPLGYIDARTAIDTALRVRDAVSRRAA